MTMTNLRPAYVRSIVRLECEKCGAEANATCTCGMKYVPVAQRIAEYDKTNPGKSTRQAAADLGVSQQRVSQLRKSGDNPLSPEIVKGRDGKTYKARRPSYVPDAAGDDPSADGDLIDQIVDLFEQLTRNGRVKCALRLQKVMHERI